MNKIHLSKSKYCQGIQCEKILWLSEYKPKAAAAKNNESVFENGRQVGEIAKGMFGDYEDIPFNKNLSIMIEKTDKLLEDKPNIITEASFSFDNNFCSVDILKNDEDGVEIYEVKSSASIKDIYYDDAAYQYFVLSNLGLNVKKVSIVYLNSEYYRRTEELDLKKLFKKEDVTSQVKEKQNQIRNKIDFINNYMESHDADNEPDKQIGNYCCNPYPCDFWQYCTRNLPKPNVFELKNIQWSTKFKKYYEGKITLEDLKNEKVSDNCFEQIDFEINNREPKIEKEVIKELLDSLKYPLYFIDYETCPYAIPQFKNTHVYQQIPFQYSLHIIKEKGAPLEHKEFLAEVGDENMIRNFAESMVNDISEEGSVLVYNKKFEMGINNKIKEQFSDLKNEIDRINKNIIDIMEPFNDRNYYTKEMKGHYSIKYVLPALYPDDPELDYSKLPLIHDGGEALTAFLTLKDKSPKKQKEIREALLKYCELDTYAMVKIWEKFKEVTDYD